MHALLNQPWTDVLLEGAVIVAFCFFAVRLWLRRSPSSPAPDVERIRPTPSAATALPPHDIPHDDSNDIVLDDWQPVVQAGPVVDQTSVRQRAAQDVVDAAAHDPAQALRAALSQHHGQTFEPHRQNDVEKPLVLIVDDSKSALGAATRALKNHYRLLTAENGLDALNKMHHTRPALVVTDVEMPHMDGFALLRNLRQSLEFADIPIIMMTGNLRLHIAVGATEGVNGFVPKPYEPDDLLAQVHYLLRDA